MEPDRQRPASLGGGEPVGGGEAGRVADVTEDEPGHDRADAVNVEQRGACGRDGVGDVDSGGDDVMVEAADVGEELAGETLAFDGRHSVGAHTAQELGGSSCGQAPGCATGDEFSQRDVEPARRLGAQRSEVVVAVDAHTDNGAVVVGMHRA